MSCLALILGATAVQQSEAAAAAKATQESVTAPTILIELVVTDSKDAPISGLKAGELEVIQEGRVQHVDALNPEGAPGHYQLSYTPVSGKVAGVTVRALRPGAHVAGPDGSFLKPRVVPGLSPLEAELAGVLDSRPDANDFPSEAAVLHFEARPDGVHHTLVVDVPFTALHNGELQLLARVKSSAGRTLHHFGLEQPLAVASPGRHFVWTGDVHLPPGRYTLETLVVDAGTARRSTRSVSFEAPVVSRGLHMSSVTLLQMFPALLIRYHGDDDPLFFGGVALMPTFGLSLPAESDATVRFFVTLYPDPETTEPVTLRLDLLRDGSSVGSVPIPLPPPDADGRIRYVGDAPTRTFPAARYALRLVARQGGSEASEEARLTISGGALAAPIPVVPRD